MQISSLKPVSTENHIQALLDEGERRILSSVALALMAPALSPNKNELLANLQELSATKLSGKTFILIANQLQKKADTEKMEKFKQRFEID